MGEPRLLVTLAPYLPLPLLTELLDGVRRAAVRAGCSEPEFGDGLQVWARLPGPGTRVEHHDILILPYREEPGAVRWSCSCAEVSVGGYGSVGDAMTDAVEHVPAGQDWMVVPHRAVWARPDEMDG